MARTSVYLNFMGKTEEAFNFYKQVFGTDFTSPVLRMRDVPQVQDNPPYPSMKKTSGVRWMFNCAGEA